jgi:hypothetical protein
MVGNFRNNFYRLATALLEEADALQNLLAAKARLDPKMDSLRLQTDSINKEILMKRTRAKEVMDYMRKTISDEAVPTEPYFLMLEANVYLNLNEREIARSLLEKAIYRATESLDFIKAYKGEVDPNDFDLLALRFSLQLLGDHGFDDLFAYTVGKLKTYLTDPAFQSALDALLRQLELRKKTLPNKNDSTALQTDTLSSHNQ